MIDQQVGQFSIAVKRSPMQSAGVVLAKSVNGKTCSHHQANRGRVCVSCRMGHVAPARRWK